MYAFSVLLFGFGMFWIVFFAYHFFKYRNPYKLFMSASARGLWIEIEIGTESGMEAGRHNE